MIPPGRRHTVSSLPSPITFLLLLTAVTVTVGCPSPPSPATVPPSPVTTILPPPITFLEDLDIARAKAAAERKLLFVDVWAPWCHTCLSMKHYVFPDPSLRPLAQTVVFAAIDSDQPSSATFLERFPVSAWPTFFVIDPSNESILAYWPGSASASELRALIDDAARVADANALPGDPLRALAEARAALSANDLPLARNRFEALLARVPSAWPRRTEVLLGLMQTLRLAKDYDACARLGHARIKEVVGASRPADFAWYTLDCADKLPPSPTRTAAQSAAMLELRSLVDSPPTGASIDDRADSLGTLADALESTGDPDGARVMHDRRITMLERAAAAAPDPATRSTFDYLLANSYLARGRGDDAVRLLLERERQMPESYEPPARLADVLLSLGRYDPALAAIDRALSHAYGPRKLRYLATKAVILEKLGRRAEQVSALRDELAGWDSLRRGQANESRRADARRRLDDALGDGTPQQHAPP